MSDSSTAVARTVTIACSMAASHIHTYTHTQACSTAASDRHKRTSLLHGCEHVLPGGVEHLTHDGYIAHHDLSVTPEM